MTALLTRYRPNRGQPLPPFDPLSVPAYASFWASDPAWTPPADGAAVALWPDASGNGRDAAQATGDNQPTFRSASSGMGNKPVIEFDGVNDRLLTAAFGVVLAQPNEMVAVVRYRSLVANAFFVDGITSTARNAMGVGGGGTTWRIFAGGSAVQSGGISTTRRYFRGVFDATSTVFVDGTQIATGNAGAHGIDGIRMGANQPLTIFAAVDVAFLALFDTPLTTQQRNDLLNWSRAFYGTP